MSASNGKTTTATPAADESPERHLHRPQADIGKVYAEIEQSLKEIVWEATHQACGYVSLASVHYGDSTTARYGHLVDAAECLEIAMTHLGLLKAAVGYRLAIDGDQHHPDTGIPPDLG